MKIDYQVKYTIIADNREEAEAAISELHENMPIVSFSFVKKLKMVSLRLRFIQACQLRKFLNSEIFWKWMNK